MICPVCKCNPLSAISRQAPGSHLKRPLTTQMLGGVLSRCTSQPGISHPAQSDHPHQVPTYATNPNKIDIRCFSLLLQTHATVAAGLSTGKPGLSRTAEAVIHPPASFPHCWDSPELTLLSIFDHYLGQVLLLLLLARAANQSSLWETVPLNMRKRQHRPLVELLY